MLKLKSSLSRELIRAEMNEKLLPTTINCKEFISDGEGKKTPLLSLVSLLPSSPQAFVEGPHGSVSRVAEANVGVLDIKGQRTHTEEHA